MHETFQTQEYEAFCYFYYLKFMLYPS